MAKIGTLKVNVKGVDYTINLNCDSSGSFNANIPKEIAEALKIQEKLSFKTLVELEREIKSNVERYKNAETTHSLFIAIRYQASGYYKNRAGEGTGILFPSANCDYNLEKRFGDGADALGFEFRVVLKETVDGVEHWYNTIRGSSTFASDTQKEDPFGYFKGLDKFDRPDKYKKIPFSPEALETLSNAREVIRQASEALFNFIEQDEEMILSILTQNKLLG